MDRKNTVVLFDVDGTLTPARLPAEEGIKIILRELRKKVCVALVGGSDLPKLKEQMGSSLSSDWDYVFCENGLVAFKDGKEINRESIRSIGEDNLKRFINFCLTYIAGLDIPIKRGTFIEFRSGMINVSPIGRDCSREERIEFEKYDKIHNIRSEMVNTLRTEFADLDLYFSIGGQISFDVFPKGWDKTYCLRFLDSFSTKFFFGDKTHPGGNDHEISEHPATKSFTVTGPDHTVQLLKEHFSI